MYYTARNRRSKETEKRYNVTWLPADELIASCDIVSLHTDVNPSTAGLADGAFIRKMKPGAILVNTSRGELVDNMAVREALISGRLAGFAADTIAPEPVAADNPLAALPEDVMKKVFYSPHLGGITGGTFRRAHRQMWEKPRVWKPGRIP